MNILHLFYLAGAMGLDINYGTSKVLSKLNKPGVVAVLGRECTSSKKLKDVLDKNRVEHAEVYVEDDPNVRDYIVQYNKAQVPVLYVNGEQADVNSYLASHGIK